jgi:signal transduction histidine kinase/ActR/RegA family two-component response regulator
MHFQLTPYAIALLICACATSAVAIAVWHRRTARGGMPLLWFTLAAIQWQLTGAGEAAAVGVQAKVLWSKINYVGILSAPVFLFTFALVYAHRESWLNRRNVALLWAAPAMTFGLTLTNEWHHLIWTGFTPSTDPAAQNVLVYEHGPWFWVMVSYVYVLLSTATVVLVLAALRSRHLYRRQATWLLFAMPFPWVGNVLYVFNLGPFPGQDLTPVGFMLAGALLAVSLFEFRLLDLVPMARDVVIDTMTDGVLVLDADHRILDANPAARQLVGADALRLGEHVGRALAAWPALAEACQAKTETHTDIPIASPPLRHLDVRSSDLLNRYGTVSGRVVVMRDITERRALEARLSQQERLAAVGQLAADIAHDFRNMLATVLLYAEMDLNTSDLPSRLEDHLRIIVKESNKAADLVQQMLDFGSCAMIEPRPLDVSAFIAEAIEKLRHTIPENIRISLQVEPVACAEERQTEEPPAFIALADRSRLQQVVANLALNACDAMPEGGDLRFTLSSLHLEAHESPSLANIRPGHWIRLTISDTGMGMTERVQRHVFEPFFTTKDVDKGTGLGLAQVYGIVRQHKGAIDVKTAPGQGTTFRIYLPHYEATSKETHAARTASAMPQQQAETILLVEDDEALREAEQAVLESLGYRVVAAANGRQALSLCQSPRWLSGGLVIDLVITDPVMPEVSGRTLMRELSRSQPHLRALGITGYAVESVTEELRELGFVDLIQKPLDAEVLARAIRHILD